MKKITLTRGQFALVDDDWFYFLNQFKWQLSTKGYAIRTVKDKTIWMHRIILNTPKDYFTDHINGNKIDNRKSNLRIAKGSQNYGNVGLPKHNTSGFKGVSFEKSRNKYEAYISKKDKKVHLERFKTSKEAALVYNQAAQEYFGKFAKLNTI